jgi:hypothetical protein
MQIHIIDRVDPSTRISVRSVISEVLRDYGALPERPLFLGKLFWRVINELSRKDLIDRKPHPDIWGPLPGSDEFFNPPPSFEDYRDIPPVIVALVCQVFWELYIEGVLAPVPSPRDDPDELGQASFPLFMSLDYVMLTPYGTQVLHSARDRIQIHDPDGYLTNFRGAQPAPDNRMMDYLVECVRVFKGGHLVAAVVLLGAASERLIEVLATELQEALDRSGRNGTAWFKDYNASWPIKKRFHKLHQKLAQEYNQDLKKLDERYFETVKHIFHEIRKARNEDIHNTGDDKLTWNEVGGLLHWFVRYFKLLNKTIAFLREQ